MVQATVYNAEVEAGIRELRILRVLEGPGIRRVFRPCHPNVEVRDGHLLEAMVEKGLPITLAAGDNQHAVLLGMHYSLADESPQNVLVKLVFGLEHTQQMRECSAQLTLQDTSLLSIFKCEVSLGYIIYSDLI